MINSFFNQAKSRCRLFLPSSRFYSPLYPRILKS